MMQLVRSLDRRRYSPRTYIYCSGDSMSLVAAKMLEAEISSRQDDPIEGEEFAFLELPRARKVAQPLLSSAATSAWTLLFALWHLVFLPAMGRPQSHPRDFRTREPVSPTSSASPSRESGPGIPFDALLINGPGTCVMIVIACYIARVS
jgi:beta-1,4-N-acetylglucosaminyltransferase